MCVLYLFRLWCDVGIYSADSCFCCLFNGHICFTCLGLQLLHKHKNIRLYWTVLSILNWQLHTWKRPRPFTTVITYMDIHTTLFLLSKFPQIRAQILSNTIVIHQVIILVWQHKSDVTLTVCLPPHPLVFFLGFAEQLQDIDAAGFCDSIGSPRLCPLRWLFLGMVCFMFHNPGTELKHDI